MTHNLMKLVAPGRMPSDATVEQTVRHAFALDASGRLVIERLIGADPMPWSMPTRSETPKVWTSVYEKSH